MEDDCFKRSGMTASDCFTSAIAAGPTTVPAHLVELARAISEHPPYFGATPSHHRYFVGGWAYLTLGWIDDAFELLGPVIRMMDRIKVPLSALQILACAYLVRKDTQNAARTLVRINDLHGINADTLFLCICADQLCDRELASMRTRLVLSHIPPAVG